MTTPAGVRLPEALAGAGAAVAVVAEARGRWGEVAAGLGFAIAVVATASRRPGWSLLVGTAANLTQLLDGTGFRLWPALVSALACLLAGRRMVDGLPALPAFAAVTLAGLLGAVLAGDVWRWVGVVVPLLFAGVLPWFAGRHRRLRAGLVEAGWQRAEQLEREQRLIATEARLRERTRIAQDMHDSLGHELSLITLRAGALELHGSLDPVHRHAIGELRAALGEATDRLREIIGVLRDGAGSPAQAAPERIEELVARSRSSGMDITLAGDPGAIPPAVGRIAYRVVQEALTNAAKHAPGAPVTVRLADTAGGTVVAVTNQQPPAGQPAPAASRGHGLARLRERVRLAGGSLRAQARAGGYEVVAQLPAAIGEEDPAPWSGRHIAGERQTVRRAARRGLAAAAAVPVALTAVVLLILFVLRVYEVTNSLLEPTAYEAPRIGQPRA